MRPQGPPSLTPSQSNGSGPFNVARWLTGFGLGLVGDQIFYLALAWTAAQVAAPAMAGLIVGIGAAPRAVFLLFGGAVSDRFGPRPVALVSDAARLLTMLVFGILAITSSGSVPELIILALLFGLIDAFFLPAVGALPTRIVTQEHLAETQTIRSAVQRISTVAGPPLGGYLLSTFDFATAILANVALFTGSCTALYFTRELPQEKLDDKDPAEVGLVQNAWQGLRYTLSAPGLRAMLVLITIAESAYTGPFTTGLTLLARESHWQASDAGMVLAFFGGGACISALGLTIFKADLNAGILALASITAMGPAVAAIGLSPNLGLAALCATVAGVFSGISATVLVALFLTQTDPSHAGRVMAALNLATLGAAPVSYFFSGLIASVFSPTAVFMAAGALLCCSGLLGLMSPAVRNQRF
ncbi:MFS transporter [Rothia uropygialis]|uniref:MFS transporter n=1 Tax=Kocuria sp. 36 TaxID=1415402 RepID=UPI00101C67C5|nr:MFS transporter [Kocuria sp. 36]